jgi:hypothetical protein
MADNNHHHTEDSLFHAQRTNTIITATRSNRNHIRWLQIIGRWPQATRAIQHHRRSLLLPPLPSRSRLSILRWGGLTKQPQRQHEDGAMGGWSCFSAQDVLGRRDQ